MGVPLKEPIPVKALGPVEYLPEPGQHALWDRWFRNASTEFKPLVAPFWAGASAEYVAREILTHPNARGFGIDPYDPQHHRRPDEVPAVRQRARERLAQWTVSGKWQWIIQPSQDALRWLGPSIDLLYLDGSHLAHDVLCDFCLAWQWLKPGSVVIFDDYGWPNRKAGMPHVREAFNAIEATFGERVAVIHRGKKQAALRVVRK